MATGYCPSILLHLAALGGCDTAKKLHPTGFLSAVLSSMDGSATTELEQQYAAGHKRVAAVKYRKRPLASAVVDGMVDCDVSTTNPYAEFTPTSLITKSKSVFIDYATIRQYCADASNPVNITKTSNGTVMLNNQTRAMQEVYDLILSEATALVKGINIALVTAMSTTFGKNVTTGLATSKAISFSLTSNGMSDAFVTLMADARENEICDTDGLTLVGSGPFANLDLIRKWFANGPADNGLNKANMLDSFPNVFYDKDAASIWGANQVGMFEKGSVALVNYPQYVGGFAGKMANSELFNMRLPLADFCCPQPFLDRLAIDVQIVENDCPTSMTLDGGAAASAGMGVNVILSWTGALFVRPTTLYRTGDPLDGVNGALRYTITAS